MRISLKAALRLAVATGVLMPGIVLAQALPEGGQVVSGQATIATPSASQMNINQGSDRAIVNWQGFSIGENARVDITQPNTDSFLLNRVTGSGSSQLLGQMNANGQVALVNPNGIFIGPNGVVNAQGFIASTLDISDGNFNLGQMDFNGNGASAGVVNAGTVEIGRGGYAALIGGQVRNDGIVRVPTGRVGFASGERVTLDFSGDQFLQVAIPTGADADGALIDNSGVVSASQIEMRAATARQAVRQAVNLSGVAEATSVSVQGGAIVLGGGNGGTVQVSGRADASSQQGRGGAVTITGQDISLVGAAINVSGGAGGGQVRVGGDFRGGLAYVRADRLSADAETAILADAIMFGNGGDVVLWSDDTTTFAGNISARGGANGGDGGFVEVSGAQTLNFSGLVDTRAPAGAWGSLLLDPTNIFISGDGGSAADLEDNLELGNVTLDTSAAVGSDAGNIIFDSDVDLIWAAQTTLTLQADNNVELFGSVSPENGGLTIDAGSLVNVIDGANITVNQLRVTAPLFVVNGSVVETGGGGSVNVGTFSLGSEDALWQQVSADLSPFAATNFQAGCECHTFLRTTGGDGSVGNPHQIVDIFGLQSIGSSALQTDSFILADDIEAAGTSGWNFFGAVGFRPIGTFDGNLDGNLNAVTDLVIENPEFEGVRDDAALILDLGSTASVTDLDIIDADILGQNAAVLAVSNAGTIANVFVSGNVEATPGFSFLVNAGGLVAENTGTIESSAADVAVAVDSLVFSGDAFAMGGLVGNNAGEINLSHAIGDVSTTSGDGFFDMGGFVGTQVNAGRIADSYAQGAVTVTGPVGGSVNAGGFVGFVDGEIRRSYATGAVSVSGGTAGGFAAAGVPPIAFGPVGSFDESDLSFAPTDDPLFASNFWDTVTSGQSTSAVGIGLTTEQFQDTETFLALAGAAGWDFGSTWAPGENGFYAQNYATSAVIFAAPDAAQAFQYGDTDDAVATGSIAGGPGLFLLGPDGDTIDPDQVFNNLVFDDETVGTRSITLGNTDVTSNGGVTYRIVSQAAAAQVTPAPLTITADDQTKIEGTVFTFEGSEFTTSALARAGDSVNTVLLTSDGAPIDALPANSPFAINLSDAVGVGLANYDITFAPGVFTVSEIAPEPVDPEPTDPAEPEIPEPPVIVVEPLPNPKDEVVGGGFIGASGAAENAGETLVLAERAAAALEIAASACESSSGDVTRYLACLADSLDQFADELDQISTDLPPGLENVAQIIQTARVQIDAARTRAGNRLATATTDAERTAIRRDAVAESNAALAGAASEIRKAITLVRAEDPELAGIQRATIATTAAALDTVGIQLTRAVGL